MAIARLLHRTLCCNATPHSAKAAHPAWATSGMVIRELRFIVLQPPGGLFLSGWYVLGSERRYPALAYFPTAGGDRRFFSHEGSSSAYHLGWQPRHISTSTWTDRN